MTKNVGYIKIRKNLLYMPEMAGIQERYGFEGLGAYMAVLLYLSNCNNCIGTFDKSTLHMIGAFGSKSTKFMKSIIKDFNLFDINGKTFTSKLLRISYGINKNAHSASAQDIDKDTSSNEEDNITDAQEAETGSVPPRRSLYEKLDEKGRRLTLDGKIIPKDAAPAPNSLAVWSFVRRRWIDLARDDYDIEAERKAMRIARKEGFGYGRL